MKVFMLDVIMNNKGVILTLIVGILIPFFLNEPYLISIFILIILFAYLGLCWDFIGGKIGYVSLGQAVFFGFGAYASAVFFNYYGVSPWVSIWIGVVLSLGASLIIGYLCFRTGIHGAFFAFFTLAFNEIIRIVISAGANLPALAFLGGPEGITIKVVPSDNLLVQLYNLQFLGVTRNIAYYYLFLGMLITGLLVDRAIERSRFGYHLKAIKGDEYVAQSLGINTLRSKLYIFCLSAALSSIAGSVYSFYVGHVQPSAYMGLSVTLQILLSPIIGGSGYPYGALLGAIIVVGVSYIIKNVINPAWGASLTTLVYGLIVIIVILYLPEGIVRKVMKIRKRA